MSWCSWMEQCALPRIVIVHSSTIFFSVRLFYIFGHPWCEFFPKVFILNFCGRIYEFLIHSFFVCITLQSSHKFGFVIYFCRVHTHWCRTSTSTAIGLPHFFSVQTFSSDTPWTFQVLKTYEIYVFFCWYVHYHVLTKR